jgi:hypothetical protein
VSAAFDAHGDAVAIWEADRDRGDVAIVQSDVRPASSSAWRAPVLVSSRGRNAGEPEVAADPHGKATAVWMRFDDQRYTVQSASYAR